MFNQRFPHKDEGWVVDARRNRSLGCSVAMMTLVSVFFTVALMSGCTRQAAANSSAINSAPAASAPAIDSARSDFKFDDSRLEPWDSEYSRYVLG